MIQNIKIYGLILVFLLFLIPIGYAKINIDIIVEDSFNIGETVSFDYTMTSNISQEIIYIPHITCPDAPVALLQEKTTHLEANQPYINTYTNTEVEDWIETQTCTAYIYITSPIKQYISKNFTIATSPSFDFTIITCKDSACQQRAKTFIKNENIHLDYFSSVSEPEITAKLTYPDKSSKQINLPYSLKASQIGTYNLEITASKEGYKAITKKEQFGVIEKNPSIGYAIFKDDKEKVSIRDEKKKDKTKYLIIFFISVIVLIGFIIFLVWRKMRKGALEGSSIVVKK